MRLCLLLLIIAFNIFNTLSYNIYVGSTGILFPYSLGALAYIKTRVKNNDYYLSGISGGSWCSILFHFEDNLQNHDKLWNTFIKDNRTISILDQNSMKKMQNEVSKTMIERYKNKDIKNIPISIIVTELQKFGIPKNIAINDFENIEDLINLSLCSSYIPFICGKGLYKTYKNKKYVDGAIFHKKPKCDEIDIDIDKLLRERRFQINHRLSIDIDKSRYLFNCGWDDAKNII